MPVFSTIRAWLRAGFGFLRRDRAAVDPRHALGRAGETHAQRYLTAKGHRVLARGYRTPVGELDLVTRDGDAVVIVEVKTRRDARFADAVESVTPAKQARMARAAGWFVHERRLEASPLRFDVIAVTFDDGLDRPPRIEHFEDAFRP
jgi:putative endonuclease